MDYHYLFVLDPVDDDVLSKRKAAQTWAQIGITLPTMCDVAPAR
jgi:hypothetical protein